MIAPLPAHSILVKPRMRGVLHQWSFFASLVLGLCLVLAASGGRETAAACIYAASVAALLGTSAAYHRIEWSRENARRWMRRLDHSMIFVLIAGTYTPFSLLVLDGTLATVILIVVWSGAVAGIVLQLVWIDAPAWLSAAVYVALGWVAVAAFPGLIDGMGLLASLLVAAGGLLYTVGVVFHVMERLPFQNAIWHGFVLAAAACHYGAVCGSVLVA